MLIGKHALSSFMFPRKETSINNLLASLSNLFFFLSKADGMNNQIGAIGRGTGDAQSLPPSCFVLSLPSENMCSCLFLAMGSA